MKNMPDHIASTLYPLFGFPALIWLILALPSWIVLGVQRKKRGLQVFLHALLHFVLIAIGFVLVYLSIAIGMSGHTHRSVHNTLDFMYFSGSVLIFLSLLLTIKVSIATKFSPRV